jgi:hypothetical protein
MIQSQQNIPMENKKQNLLIESKPDRLSLTVCVTQGVFYCGTVPYRANNIVAA